MNISITTPSETRNDHVLISVTNRVMKTLVRFSDRIARVNVILTDENGPRGGIDKRCRVCVVMPGVGELSTSARHDNLWTATSHAARRARRMIVSRLKRPDARRAKRRRNRFAIEAAQAESTFVESPVILAGRARETSEAHADSSPHEQE